MLTVYFNNYVCFYIQPEELIIDDHKRSSAGDTISRKAVLDCG